MAAVESTPEHARAPLESLNPYSQRQPDNEGGGVSLIRGESWRSGVGERGNRLFTKGRVQVKKGRLGEMRYAPFFADIKSI